MFNKKKKRKDIFRSIDKRNDVSKLHDKPSNL